MSPFALDAVKDSTSLPLIQNVDITILLLSRSSKLSAFSPLREKAPPVVHMTLIPAFGNVLRITTDPQNGKLINNLQGEQVNVDVSLNRTDIRLHAHLCNEE